MRQAGQRPVGFYRRLQRIQEYVLAHLEQRLTIKEVADAVGVSRATLQRLFRQGIGLSFSEWCRRVRLKEAMRLLLSENLNEDEVVFLCGFGSTRTLQRVFRRYLDTTPSAFQRGEHVPRVIHLTNCTVKAHQALGALRVPPAA